MSNFEMGFNNPLEENKNEEEKNNELTAEVFASLLKEVQDKKNLLNNEKFQEGLEEKEDPEINQEVIEEFKNKEEIELSSIEVKKPFTNKIRKTLLIMTAVLALSSVPVFASSQQNNQYENQKIEVEAENMSVEGLEINKAANIIQFTYIPDKKIDYMEYQKDRKYRVYAKNAFNRALNEYYGIDNSQFARLNDVVNEDGNVVLTINLDTFEKQNLNKNQRAEVESKKSIPTFENSSQNNQHENQKVEVGSENRLSGKLEMVNENTILRYTYMGDTHPEYETLINSLTEDIKTKLKFKTVTLPEFSIKMQNGKIVMETNFEDFQKANIEEMNAFLKRVSS